MSFRRVSSFKYGINRGQLRLSIVCLFKYGINGRQLRLSIVFVALTYHDNHPSKTFLELDGWGFGGVSEEYLCKDSSNILLDRSVVAYLDIFEPPATSSAKGLVLKTAILL